MAVPKDPAPRGCWKRERNPVCGVLLAGCFPLASVFAPLLIRLHTEQDRAGVLNTSQPHPPPCTPRGFGLFPGKNGAMGWFHSVLWGIDAQIEAVSKSLLCVTLPMELLQARGWLLPLGDPCSVPVPLPASGIYQHHVASLRKGCSSPKVFNGSELISPGCCAPAVPQLCPQGLGDEFVSLQSIQ